MDIAGKFRVVDSWTGQGKTGEARASVTLTDTETGGQFRLSFPDGKIPSAFALDALVGGFSVKPINLAKFGLMLSFVSMPKGK